LKKEAKVSYLTRRLEKPTDGAARIELQAAAAQVPFVFGAGQTTEAEKLRRK
jgi:hypothetical protein